MDTGLEVLDVSDYILNRALIKEGKTRTLSIFSGLEEMRDWYLCMTPSRDFT